MRALVATPQQNGGVTTPHSNPGLPLLWPEARERALQPTGAARPTDAARPTGAARPSDTTRPRSEPEVVVRTSTRRKKTAAAFWEGQRIVVVLPARVDPSKRDELVSWLVRRAMAARPKAAASDDALATRAQLLADRFVDGVRPASIRWVTNQDKRWGSCTAQTREIRISHRLRGVPEWVLDATIVHELAHLVHPDHSGAFYAIANRHPRQREAHVFLEGYALGLGERP